MEIRHLKLIQSVAEQGSLTRAAAQLFLSQSALSHQLKELELELDAQLFVRTGKKMLPTAAGMRLLQTAETILCEMDQLKCDIHRMTRENEGTLRFTTGCYTCYHWLSPVLKSYKEEFPKVKIDVIPEATYEALDYLLDGKVDLVFTSDYQENPNLQFRTLFADELQVIVSPDHPWAGRKKIYPKDFTEETLIMVDVPDENSTIINEVFKANDAWPGEILRLKLTEAVIEMTKAEMGASILAEWSIQPYLERGELVAIPLARKVVRNWYSVSLKKRALPNFMCVFIDELECALACKDIARIG